MTLFTFELTLLLWFTNSCFDTAVFKVLLLLFTVGCSAAVVEVVAVDDDVTDLKGIGDILKNTDSV